MPHSPAAPGLALAVALVAAGSCGGGSSAAPAGKDRADAGKAARAVAVAPVESARLERTVSVTGTLAAEDQVTVSFKVAGRLETLAVDLGSSVGQGQNLGRLVPTDFELRVTQADAALQQARARLGLTGDGGDDHVDPAETALVRQARAVLDQAALTRDRTAATAKKGIVSQADLDAAEANFRVADGKYQDALEEVRNRQAILSQRRIELQLAKQALNDSRLTAPFAGRVRERHATPGQYLAAGAPVVTIVKVHPLRLRLSIPEREAAAVRAGQRVRVTLEGDTAVHEGRVARVSPAIEETSRTLSIEAEVANPAGTLRPGAFANADVVTETRDTTILVPAAAIVSFAGVERVFVVKDGKAAERRVTTGRRDGARVEVTEGLSAGDHVVVKPGNLVDGEAVSPGAKGGRP
jgi:RND family efflux transporter MFP subunit